MARELKNNIDERYKMYSANLKSQKLNTEIRNILIELKQEISIANIEKHKLWVSQEN